MQDKCLIVNEDVSFYSISLFDYNPDQFNEIARGIKNTEYQKLNLKEKYLIDQNFSLIGNATMIEEQNHMNGGWQNGFYKFDEENQIAIQNQRVATQDIVEKKLKNGQLQLRNKNKEDLTYFPTIEQAENKDLVGNEKPYQEILRDWKMPFIREKSGYFYFDSDKYHVKRNDNEKILELHKGVAGGISEWGIRTTGLFPFNKDCYTNEDTLEENNLFYGLRLDFDFYMTNSGQTLNLETKEMEDIIYRFTGDDDVWVFIDDNLILDIGGGKAVLFDSYINFARNESYIGMVNDPTNNTVKKDVYEKNIFGEHGLEEGKHTLTMFYMERFGGSSNLKVRFNLPEVISYEGYKEWRDNQNVLGLRPKTYTLQLYGDGEWIRNQIFQDTNWKFDELPKYNEKGKEIIYSVKEDEIILDNGDKYKPTIENNRVINTLQGQIQRQIKKVWEDVENKMKTRPDEIIITIKAKE